MSTNDGMTQTQDQLNKLNDFFRVKAEEYFASQRQQSQPTERLRVITKMAKNVNPGDLIDFPGYGWHEIGGWSQVDGVVSISAPGVPMLNFDMNERVRIQRRVVS